MKYGHVHNFNHFDHICEFEIALLVCGDNTIFVQEDRYNRDVPITCDIYWKCTPYLIILQR